MTINQRIKTQRTDLGISQSELARRVGVKVQAVQQWEEGKTTPRRNKRAQIAAALGRSESWLEFGEEQAAQNLRAIAITQTVDEPSAAYPDLTPEALHLARTWMQLSPARRAQFHEEIVWTAVFERKFPYFRIGRPLGESYDKLEQSIEANWEKMVRQAKLPLD